MRNAMYVRTAVTLLSIGIGATAALAAPPAMNVNTVTRAQITARPQRVRVRPVDVRMARPVFVVDNKPEVDLRPEIDALGIPVRAQGGRNTCSVFATTFLLDYMYAKHYGVKNADYSEEFLNYASNKAIRSEERRVGKKVKIAGSSKT